jgi:MFS transporter, DHA2 family, multidrug resistance protein
MHATSAVPDPRRWLVLAVLASGLLVISMDATVLNVALPTLAADLRPGATELLWIVDAYGLVLAGLLVAMGGLGDRIGRRRLLTAGLLVFGAASVVAAVSSAPEQLIAARALLGVGGAMIMPSTLSVLRNVFPDARERTVAIGIWSAVASGGFAIGPVVGGAVLEVAPWGWVFVINVPIAVVAVLAVRAWVPESRNPEPGPWDAPSVVLSVAGMVGVVWAVKHLGEHGVDAAGVAAATGGAAALAAFVMRQARSATPILDVRLFADRRFAGAAATVLFVFFGFAGLLLFLTQFLQVVQGASPLEAGLGLLPLAVAVAAVSTVTHRLVDRLGAHVVVGGGFALVAAGLAIVGTLDAGSSYVPVAVGLALGGAGGGLAATAGSAAIMAAAPAERAGGAAAVQETAFELGGALGVAVLGSLMAGAYREALPTGVPDAVREGLPAAAEVARAVGGEAGAGILGAAQAAFVDGLATTMGLAAAVTLAGAAVLAAVLPRRAPAPA